MPYVITCLLSPTLIARAASGWVVLRDYPNSWLKHGTIIVALTSVVAETLYIVMHIATKLLVEPQ